jgi:iron complex transport system substrate-binding protein
MVGRLGGLGHAIDERDRAFEVRERPLAHDRPPVLTPIAVSGEAFFNFLVGELGHYSHRVRIVSLVPHATELLFALGLGDQVIAVTHECDHPPPALSLPHITRDVLPPNLSAAEIDAAVRSRTEHGQAIYQLDEDALCALEPDLIVTQALCPVCAVSYEDVVKLAAKLPSKPEVISLDPHTFGETLGDVRTVAQATGSRERGVELIATAAARIDRVKLAVRAAARPRVVALEWLDPVFVAGHWTPQLIELAGGEDLLGLPGEHSITVSWDAVIAAAPEIVVVMPCGYDAPRAHLEACEHANALTEIGARRVVAVNASAYFSRPGPRLIDGLELLAHIFHPELVTDAPGEALTVSTPARLTDLVRPAG